MIIYTSLFKRGITICPWLVIIPEWAEPDKAYLAHEKVHVEQQRKHGVIYFWFKYLTKSAFRQAMEVEAYKVQIASGANLEYCAHQLWVGYDLDIDFQGAINLLK